MNRKENRKDVAIAALIIAAGIVISGFSLMELARGQPQFAQAQAQQQPAPSVPAGNANAPARAKPGGTRPTTPAPEPAQPGRGAEKKGMRPALPPAPAEKMAPPIKAK
ncbi:MAG TPA: hypothetical protein VHC94_01500 [Nitrobacter sp.]|nr:hypothetical protein [Nitrobacter sp.]